MDRLHLLVFLVTLCSSALSTNGYVNQSCVLQLHKNEIQNKRNQLDKWIRRENVILIYVHVKSHIVSRSKTLQDDPHLKNRLMQWLLVMKSEKHLAQLPVDSDIVTFDLFEYIGEQKHIDISVTLENEYCAFTEKSIGNAKQILWSTLFTNHSENFLLCNRKFKSDWLREGIYWVTTVWNGYDLNCTAQYGDEVFDVGKTTRLNLIPVFCFILALQYVWLFRLLDITPYTNSEQYKKASKPKQWCIFKWQTIPYKENDRPYGIKRIFQKILFTEFNSSNTCLTGMFNLPSARLVGFLYLVVILPTNLYNIVYRYKISKNEGDTYLNILKPVEPLCSLTECSYSAYQCDLGFSIVSIILGAIVAVHKYETFSNKCFLLKNDTQSSAFVQNIRKNIRCIINSLTCCCCCSCGTPDVGAEEDSCKWCSVFVFLILIPLSVLGFVVLGVMLALLVLLLVGVAIVTYVCCGCCGVQTCKGRPEKNIDYCCSDTESYIEVPLQTCSGTLSTNRSLETPSKMLCGSLTWVSLILLVLCHRSILSGLTFFIREITYLLFVILPVRIDLFRYFLIFLTAVVHMGKYYSELVNMSTEILNEMFIQANGDVKYFTEENFSKVMTKLRFSHRFYLFLFKCLIVFSYIFITVEALLSSQKLKSSRHFESFLSYIFIALSPSAVSFIYSKYKDQYLTEEQKTKIRDKPIKEIERRHTL